MVRALLLAMVVVASACSNVSETPQQAACAEVETGLTEFSVSTNGTPQMVRVFVPTSFDASPLPLVVNWHGLGSTGFEQAQFTGYEQLAESEGFIVAHPTGLPAPGDTRNAWELAQFDTESRDDVALAGEIIDVLVADFCADEQRVYSTGMSNGGFFTSRLVCELSDRIAAGVSVAGVSHPDGCDPGRPVPFLAYHGTDDNVVPFAGGDSTLESGDGPAAFDGFFDQVMPDEVAEFAADFGCDPAPTTTDVSPEVIRYTYGGCDGDVPVVFVEITGGGHTWPGSPLGAVLTDALGYTTDDVAATADGWAFMSQFSLPSE